MDYKLLWDTLLDTHKNTPFSKFALCGTEDEKSLKYIMTVEVMCGGYCEKDDYENLWESLHNDYGCLTKVTLRNKDKCSLGSIMSTMKKTELNEGK